MTKLRYILWAGLLMISNCVVSTNPATAVANCDDVKFIFARGSGEELNDTSATAWQSSITAAMQGVNLKYSFYELGSQMQGGAQYPAVPVSGSLDAIGNMIGAAVSAGQAFSFGRSIDTGIKELKTYLNQTSRSCPRTKFVLGGYSQGAMLLSRILDDLDASKIIYVATFGDPKVYLPEGKGPLPVACWGKNFSNYRAHVPDCFAYEGLLGSYRPYQPAAFLNKLGTWCNDKDLMCSSGFNIGDHTSYVSQGLYQDAAKVIAEKVSAAFGLSNYPILQKSPHDLAIVLYVNRDRYEEDVIQGYIGQAMRLAEQAFKLGNRVALVVFQENNMFGETQFYDFDKITLNEMSTAFSKIYPTSTGSDHPNRILGIIKQALGSLSWRADANKTIALFSSKAYADPDYTKTTLQQIASLSRQLGSVNIYPLTSNPDSLTSLRTIATATDGKAYATQSSLTPAASFATQKLTNNLQRSNSSDFITDILNRPLAKLSRRTYNAPVGNEFVFDASASRAWESESLRYDWDLDGDGEFELQDQPAVMWWTYAQSFSGNIQVRVTDESGRVDTVSAFVDTTLSELMPTKINQTTLSEASQGIFEVSFETDAPEVLVSLDYAILGRLNSSGRNTLTITDVTQPVTLRLTPYSASKQRGENVEIRLIPKNTTDETIKPESPASPTTPDSTTPTIIPETTKPSFIPKVPNTGYPPRL